MKLTGLCIILMLAVSMAAGAATVNLTMGNLTANGWKTTATNIYGGSLQASVAETSDYDAGNFRFYTGAMNTAWIFQWAGLSTNAFAGQSLASISSVKIRNRGAFGGVPNWQPPTFTWVVDKGDGNQNCILWKPWTNGNARENGVWHEYDAAVTGQWFVQETGVSYNSLAALKTALPNAYFEYTADLPTAYGFASQQAFNVGNCPLYDGDRTFFSDTAGYVDWFEVGVNGNVTRYDLGPVVPEPGSFLVLGSGVLGLLSFMRRRNR